MRPMTCQCGKPGALHPRAGYVFCAEHAEVADRLVAKPKRTRINGRAVRRSGIPDAWRPPTFLQDAAFARYGAVKAAEWHQKDRDKGLGFTGKEDAA